MRDKQGQVSNRLTPKVVEGHSLKLDNFPWQGLPKPFGTSSIDSQEPHWKIYQAKCQIQLLLCFADAVSMSSLFIVVMYIKERNRRVLYFS